MSDDRVVIAEILRPRGNRGELLVLSQTDVPGRLEHLAAVQLRLITGQDAQMVVESVWSHKEHWIFKFAGVDTISEAERFTGAEIWVAKAERGELPAGRYFQSDLVGSTLVDLANHRILGTVVQYRDYGGAPLLEFEYAGRDVLVPLVPEICKVVDVDAKQIFVDLPEGLLEL